MAFGRQEKKLILCDFYSFFSPFGYGGRYIQRTNKMDASFAPDRDNYSLFNSLWHTFGVWMQQVAIFFLIFLTKVIITNQHT